MQHDKLVETAAWQEIRVDLASVRRLVDELSDQFSYDLRPTVDSIFDQLGTGASFGIKNPSVDLHAVKQKYDDCLRATVDRLAKHVTESGRLVDVLNVILTRYRTTDALASVSLDDLKRAFEMANVDGQRGG
jgi:hypothetical protein